MDDLGGKPTIFGNVHMGQVWILVFSKYLPPFTTIHAVCFEKPVVFVSSKFQVFKGSKCQVGRIFWFVPSTKMAIPRITGDFHPFIAPLLTESPWRGQGQDLEWWVPEKKGSRNWCYTVIPYHQVVQLSRNQKFTGILGDNLREPTKPSKPFTGAGILSRRSCFLER